MRNTQAVYPGSIIMPATESNAPKTDWEELADECYKIAQERGITEKDLNKAIKKVREALNARRR
ncbi:MAG: hypothetical protein K6U03_02790 [Firmicutes bacterium]|nr:hypothetical protein [Bacillota bacterium]